MCEVWLVHILCSDPISILWFVECLWPLPISTKEFTKPFCNLSPLNERIRTNKTLCMWCIHTHKERMRVHFARKLLFYSFFCALVWLKHSQMSRPMQPELNERAISFCCCYLITLLWKATTITTTTMTNSCTI